jgi:methyl-accepting chemotaxis protein
MSGNVVQDVLSHVRELSADSQRMRDQGNVIRAEVDQLLLNLQFQDRVSQIISVVNADIERMCDALGPEAAVPLPHDWLGDLANRYTTEEQRDIHEMGDPSAQPKAAGSSVDFF